MSKLKLLTIAVFFLLPINFLLVGFLFLRRPPHARPLDRIGPKNRIIEILHFEKDQVAQYEKLIGQHRTSIKLLTDRIQETRGSLYQTLQGEKATAKDSLINELGTLQKEIETIHYVHFIAIKRLCTPDQLDDFAKLTSDLADFFNPENRPAPPKQ